MKHLKIFGTLALVLLLLVSFSVFSVAQDKKQDKKVTVKTDAKKSTSSPCAEKAKSESCCDKSKKTTGKVLIKKAKEMTGSKAHDCSGCPEMKAGHKAEHKGECEHAKLKKGDNKEKK